MSRFNYFHGNIGSRANDYVSVRYIFNAEISEAFLTYIGRLGKAEELFNLLSKSNVIEKIDSRIDQYDLCQIAAAFSQ